MKEYEKIVMKDMTGDYPKAKSYIGNFLKKNNVPKVMISETLLIFEALCFRIFEQRERTDAEVTLEGIRRMGDSAIEITFEGGMYDPEPNDPAWLTPEDRVLRAYADKIDYSYHSGDNLIRITTKRNHMVSMLLYAVAILAAIAVYTLLHYIASDSFETLVTDKLVFPLETVFMNAVLMIGAPVTFLSMLKNLTDTYIISGRSSTARRLHRGTISSSIISVVLAVISSWLLTGLFFANDPMSGKYAHRVIDMDPEQLIPSLIPSDIFTPFQSILPYPLIILAALTTYAFCSVGKHFDRLKETIDVAYVLFARMLAIEMYALPFFMFIAMLDELFSDGFIMLGYLLQMCIIALASLLILLFCYCLRLTVKGIRPGPFLKKLWPLLKENALIASAFDAVPFNIRYCTRVFGFDRKRLEKSVPVLAQINLDGNCFIITMLAMLYIAINSTPLSLGEMIAVGMLVFFLSLGAPNQPGSCLVGLAIVMCFMQATDLATVAIIGEVLFGGILNLVNITGDMVTVAVEEVSACGNADELNARTEQG